MEGSVFETAAAVFRPVVEEPELMEQLTKGWALKQSAVNVRFTSDQRAYLSELYMKGEETGLKEEATTVEKHMRREHKGDERRFERKHWISTKQIVSFWSNLTMAKAKKYVEARETEILQEAEDASDESNEETEEHNIATYL